MTSTSRASGSSNVTPVAALRLSDVTGEVLNELGQLYPRAYHNSQMGKNLREDIMQLNARPHSAEAGMFRLLLVRTAREAGDAGAPVGALTVQLRQLLPEDHLGLPPVHVKRFCVAPEFRGRGIGAALLAESKRYCFGDRDVQVLFGLSAEVGALRLYGREGALYGVASIETYSTQNTGDENRAFFTRYLRDPYLRGLRLPSERDIRFAWPRDENALTLLRARGFVTQEELFASVPSMPPLPAAVA